jgi:hypothetical protein
MGPRDTGTFVARDARLSTLMTVVVACPPALNRVGPSSQLPVIISTKS